MKSKLERLLCLVGRHRWVAVSVQVQSWDVTRITTEVCDRPWCRGRTTRRRWY